MVGGCEGAAIGYKWAIITLDVIIAMWYYVPG
jgi:hypothetical protein